MTQAMDFNQIPIYEYFACAKQAIVALNSKNQIVYSNPSFETLVKKTQAQLIGSNGLEFLNITQAKALEKTSVDVTFNAADQKIEATIFINKLPEYQISILTLFIENSKVSISTKDNIIHMAKHINDMVWIMDLEGIFTFFSPNFENYLGYKPNELIGQHMSRVLTRESLQIVKTILSHDIPKENSGELNNPIRRIELEKIKKDGTTLWTEIIFTLIRDQSGEIKEILGITKDINQTKEAVDRYNQLLDLTQEASVTLNKLGFVIDCNKALEVQSGYSKEHFLGKHFTKLSLFELKYLPNYINIFSKLIRGVDVKPHEYMWKDRYGNTKYGIAHIALVKKNNRIEGIQAITTDITQTKLTKMALEASEEKYRKIFHNSPLGIIHYDKKGVIVDCNQKFVEIIGSSREVLIGLSMINQLKDKHIIESVKTSLQKGNAYYENIYQSITAKKSTPVRILFEAIYNDKNKIIGGVGLVEDISERYESEKKLKASEEKFRSIFNNAPLGILLFDKNSTIIDCNQRFLDITTLSKETLIGKNMYSDLADENLKTAVKDALDKGFGKYEDLYKSAFIKKNTHVRILFAGIKDANNLISSGIGLVEDTTEQKKAESHLRESLERLQIAVQATGLNFWTLDLASNHITINENIVADGIAKSQEKNYLFNDWSALIHPDDKDRVENEFDAYISGKKQNYMVEYRLLTPNNTYKWYITSARITAYQNGKPITVVGANFEITKVRHIEMELAEKNERIALQNKKQIAVNQELEASLIQIQNINRELKKAKEKAEESNKLKTAFLQNLSHEIRTPMNGISGFAQLLAMDNASEEKRNYYIKIINESSQQLLNIVNDIIDISKIETGLVKLNLLEIDINQLLKNVADGFKMLITDTDMQILEPEFPVQKLVLFTDSEKLQQVLKHLLSNALKYAEKGTIALGYVINKPFVKFFVKDQGPGIESDLQEIIFDRFHQGHNTETRRFAGAGLGLSISKGLIELMGGRIWVESEPGNGACFYFTLPIKNTDSELVLELSPDLPNKEQKTETKGNILVAEDEDSNYYYLHELLNMLGFNVFRAKNGIEAINWIQKQKVHFNLILMDIKMPEMDGYEATKQIKQILPDMPIVAQTAYAMADDKEKVMHSGFDDYISKPIKRQAMVQLLIKHQLLQNES